MIDAYGELVDEGCLAVFGPAITDNAVPTREAIEERFRVPAISVTGAEEWLGEWTFALPQGSMTDEPIYWAQLLAKRGHTEVGVLIERSLIGESYLRELPQGVRDATASASWRRSAIAQTAQDVGDAVRRVRDAKRDRDRALRIRVRPRAGQPRARAQLGWDPPRFMGTAFENAWINDVMWQAIVGWTGLDQYDESNPVGQQFLDRFEAANGRRPQYCVPVVNRDLATVFLHAFADAHPLTPRGVKEALERVKMVPAASGAPGDPPLVRASGPGGAGWARATSWRASSIPTA